MSINHSGEYKNEMFQHYVFAVKIAVKTTALPPFFSDINMALNISLFDFFSNSQSILLESINFLIYKYSNNSL